MTDTSKQDSTIFKTIVPVWKGGWKTGSIAGSVIDKLY